MKGLRHYIPIGLLRPKNSGDGVPSDKSEEELLEMSFLDHLEEFRWALIRGGAGVVLATFVTSFFSKWVIDVLLLGPAKADFFVYRLLGIDAVDLNLQNRTITGQFFAHWGTILAVGAIIGSPVFVYFLWKFIEPGLYSTEKRGLRFASVFATLFFMVGITFGYCVITPFALQFFSNYQISDQIVNDFDITRYFSMVTFWAFGAGLLFELPVGVYFLSKIGILTPEIMRKYRRYALVVIMILAALFTPPDPLSMVLVAVPLFFLYQLSILISSSVARKRNKEIENAIS